MRHIFFTAFVVFFLNSFSMTISYKSDISHSRYKGHKVDFILPLILCSL